jgi:exodeoxyribonuclease III
MRVGHTDWLANDEYDVVCLQEVKMTEDLFAGQLFAPKDAYWNTALKPGYSGVATIVSSALKPMLIDKGVGNDILDREGRVLTTEFDFCVIVNVYAPHSNRKLLRVKEKELFAEGFIQHLRKLRKSKKPIIILGDLNVAHNEIDLFNYKTNVGNAGFLPQERRWFEDLLSLGFVDSFRMLYPETAMYSWWGFANNLRERNIGWRIDYALVDRSISGKVIDCQYEKEMIGSDHCPLILEIDL